MIDSDTLNELAPDLVGLTTEEALSQLVEEGYLELVECKWWYCRRTSLRNSDFCMDHGGN